MKCLNCKENIEFKRPRRFCVEDRCYFEYSCECGQRFIKKAPEDIYLDKDNKEITK